LWHDSRRSRGRRRTAAAGAGVAAGGGERGSTVALSPGEAGSRRGGRTTAEDEEHTRWAPDELGGLVMASIFFNFLFD